MKINFSITGLEGLKDKIKEAGKNLANTQVPLAKTVAITTGVILLTELVMFRKAQTTLIISRHKLTL